MFPFAVCDYLLDCEPKKSEIDITHFFAIVKIELDTPTLANVATNGMTKRHPLENQYRISFLEFNVPQHRRKGSSPCIHPNVPAWNFAKATASQARAIRLC
ncbi:MAG TPA: hypothetical protein VKV04_13340 [Verrucomicrobiae bacterium]|nr:hypothetical protein [Verrucomicrobiae bacterium]